MIAFSVKLEDNIYDAVWEVAKKESAPGRDISMGDIIRRAIVTYKPIKEIVGKKGKD
jgi:metal-responsive CopG/Arc/MetJ family transcriptional regulator